MRTEFMKITKEKNCIKAEKDDGSCMTSESIDTYLLYEILQKLEEIRCGLIDIEPSCEL